MRVAVIQGTTRRNMNLLLFESVKKQSNRLTKC